MKTVLKFTLLAGCLTASAFATTFYGSSTSTLYNVTVTVTTPSEVTVGAYGAGIVMEDIAWYGGKLYGIGNSGAGSQLYSINTTTGAASTIGTALTPQLDELTFNAAGVLYGVGNGTDLYTLSLTTGTPTAVGATTYLGVGDLQFIGSTLYMITQAAAGGSNSVLNTVNLSTGLASPVGTGTGSIGVTNVDGLAYNGTTLYGLTNGGAVYTINTTGAAPLGTALSPNLGLTFTGATDTSETPEPATFGVIGLGLLGLGGIAYRRSKP